MPNSKLHGFTLVEVLITLVLLSSLLLMGHRVIGIIRQMHQHQVTRLKQTTEAALFRHCFRHDLQKAHHVTHETQWIWLWDERDSLIAEYEWQPDYWCRHIPQRDSFYLHSSCEWRHNYLQVYDRLLDLPYRFKTSPN